MNLRRFFHGDPVRYGGVWEGRQAGEIPPIELLPVLTALCCKSYREFPEKLKIASNALACLG